MAGVSLTPCRPVAAEDIRDLQCRARHARRASGGRRKLRLGTLGQQWSDSIQRAHHLAQRVGGDAGVERGGVELGVPEQSRVIMHLGLTH
jgi:hypothetical protein